MWVLEELGGPGERVSRLRPEEELIGRFADLNTVAVALQADPGLDPTPVGTALPDTAFAHDGQLTKQEIRAITLASLAPLPGELLWDIGAGAGSVAIDWLRADASLKAVAIERNAARAARIRANALSLGVPELELIEGQAPACLDGAASTGRGLPRRRPDRSRPPRRLLGPPATRRPPGCQRRDPCR